MRFPVTRRRFLHAGLAGGALSGAVPRLLSASGAAPGVTLQSRQDELRLSNGIVELVLDRRNGYFRRIRNLVTGVDHKPPAGGVWPFGIWLGDHSEPQQQVADIAAESRHTMNQRFHATSDDGVLELNYPSLLENATNRRTGVALRVRVRVRAGWDYFVVTAALRNGSPLGITSFYAGKGIVLTGDAGRETEQVTTCFFGSRPRARLKASSKGHPIYTYPWYDYHGERGGLGVAYVNRQGMMMMFDIAPDGDGVQQSWRMFNLKGYWHFEKMFPPEQQRMIYPLEPGAAFTTDEWVIAPHQGDWHRMADIYRQRYNQAFDQDYASYERAPQIARDCHLSLGTWLATFKVYMTPEEFADKAERGMAALNLPGKRVGILIHQGGTTWAKPSAPDSLACPDFFPVAPEVGGTEALKEAVARLRGLGVRHSMGYCYVMGNSTKARNYVPEADSSPWIPDWNPPAGPPPCPDNSAWMALWRDRIAPQFREAGDNSVYFDMGPVVWGICQRAGAAHLHGTNTVGILTGSVQGGVRLSQEVRKALGPEGSTMMEASGDITGRWVDIWTAFAEPTLRYTWPDKIYLGAACTVQGLNDALIYGLVPQVNFAAPNEITAALESPAGNEKTLAPLRRFLAIREKLVGAPGYPDGFRDDVGLTVSDPNVAAKAFRKPGKGITVVYYAKAPVRASITVDGGLLDNAWVGPLRRQEVALEKDEPGFFVIRQE